MKTMKNNLSKPLLVKLSDILVKTQQEVDELAVQFALGKAEASDKFEEIKDAARKRFLDLRNTLILGAGDKEVHDLRGKLDELELQFALGKAETLDFFEDQRTKISDAMHNIEAELNIQKEFGKIKNFYVAEIEDLKLKFDVLKKQFGTKNVDAGIFFKEKMVEAREEIDKLMAKAEDSVDELKEKYEDFTDEIKTAGKHIKKAIDAL